MTTAKDNGVLTDVNWVAAVEGSDDEVVDWPETSEMPDHFFEYCFNIDLVASNDDLCVYRDCTVATESDELDMFVVNVTQQVISVEENDRMLFMEEMIVENVVNARAGEEEMKNNNESYENIQ